jgi:hypothetical protein
MALRAAEKLKEHKLPCGPMDVSVDSVCRRRLHDHLDRLLDRLCEECNPTPPPSDIPKDWMAEPEETMTQKKKRMIAEAKMKVDVKKAAREYEETLMGNSKMLADPKQKITTRKKR